MLNKSFLTKVLMCGLMVVMVQMTFAQKTADELKAEREQLKSEMKSEAAQKRQEKLAKLKNPGTVGVESVDNLAQGSAKLLVSTKEINAAVPEMYTRTIGETVDGVTDVTVKKPTLEEMEALAKDITLAISGVADAQNAIQKASSDVKSVSPLKMPKVLTSLNFSKDVYSLALPELEVSAKVVANLIETLRTSDNL